MSAVPAASALRPEPLFEVINQADAGARGDSGFIPRGRVAEAGINIDRSRVRRSLVEEALVDDAHGTATNEPGMNSPGISVGSGDILLKQGSEARGPSLR
jgi:hypothetical protein